MAPNHKELNMQNLFDGLTESFVTGVTIVL